MKRTTPISQLLDQYTPFNKQRSCTPTRWEDDTPKYSSYGKRTDCWIETQSGQSDEENCSDTDSTPIFAHEANAITLERTCKQKAWGIAVNFIQALQDVDYCLQPSEFRIVGYVFENVHYAAYSLEVYEQKEVYIIVQRRNGNAFTLTGFVNSLKDSLRAAGVLDFRDLSDSEDDFLTPETTCSASILEFNPMFDPDIVLRYVEVLIQPFISLDRARSICSQLGYFSTFPNFKPLFTQATKEIIPPIMNFLKTSTDLILNRGCVKILMCVLTAPLQSLQFCQLGYLSVLCDVLRRWSGIQKKDTEHQDNPHFSQEFEHGQENEFSTVQQFISKSQTVCFIISQVFLLILSTLSQTHYRLFREQNVKGKLQILLNEASFRPEVIYNLQEVISQTI